MQVKVFVRVVSLAAGMGLLSAAPVPTPGAGADKTLEALIQDLSSDAFRSREEASQQIWQRGEAALPALEALVKGNDPEQVHRARELIWKIQLNLTPKTDSAVIKLVEQYRKASAEAKVNLFAELLGKRAWWQLLKLYASETDTELQNRLEQPLRNNAAGQGIGAIAVIAAREKLVVGDAKAAREFLEMAPADADGLLALADFHRSQGTLAAELKRAKTLTGETAAAWQLALYRASGQLVEAKTAADAAGETKISAVLAMLLGDPVPCMQLPVGEGYEGTPLQATYSSLAIRRWQGKAGDPAQEAQEILRVKTRNSQGHLKAVTALLLLGHREAAETALLQESPLEAFAYYDTMELIPEALKALGLDPAKPDYMGYVAKRFKDALNKKKPDDAIEDDGDNADDAQKPGVALQQAELALLADFLERRGLSQACQDAYLPHLAAMAAADEPAFLKLLGRLLRANSYQAKPVASPDLVRLAATAWAADKLDRWETLIRSFYGEEVGLSVWNWLGEINPTEPLSDRFHGMLALAEAGKDPGNIRQKWLDYGWEFLAKSPPDKRQAVTAKMVSIFDILPMDAVSRLKLDDLVSAGKFENIIVQTHPSYLIAKGRWKVASEYYLNKIGTPSQSSGEYDLISIASAAACLRNAGLQKQAAAQDTLVDKLALGNDAVVIAQAYFYCEDYSRASTWFQRAAIQCNPTNLVALSYILSEMVPVLLERGKWREGAAIAEVYAHLLSRQGESVSSFTAAQTYRLQSDLGRALANLKTDRPAALAMLDRCRTMIPSDGTLADDYFPALRRAGLMTQHDAWFEDCWQRISEVIAQYPNSDNTCNTAAWLAARGQRRLDEAEKLEIHALALNPNQSAYLDTMAEIYFAKGNRPKALDWSGQAVNFVAAPLSIGPSLRRQQHRFRTAPLPR